MKIYRNRFSITNGWSRNEFLAPAHKMCSNWLKGTVAGGKFCFKLRLGGYVDKVSRIGMSDLFLYFYVVPLICQVPYFTGTGTYDVLKLPPFEVKLMSSQVTVRALIWVPALSALEICSSRTLTPRILSFRLHPIWKLICFQTWQCGNNTLIFINRNTTFGNRTLWWVFGCKSICEPEPQQKNHFWRICF